MSPSFKLKCRKIYNSKKRDLKDLTKYIVPLLLEATVYAVVFKIIFTI